MHIYDTFIKGSSYSSFGYALTHENCFIQEQTEVLDTHFFATLKSFVYSDYTPKSELCSELLSIFLNYKVISAENHSQNTGAFESCFCEFLKNKNFKVLLRSRILEISREDELYKIVLYSNSGIEEIYAKKIFDTSSIENSKRFLSVLFKFNNTEIIECDEITKVFPTSVIEKAFYDGRFCIKIPCIDNEHLNNINDFKLEIANVWKEKISCAKILHFAPCFAYTSENKNAVSQKDNSYAVIDENLFDNPFAAFETGMNIKFGGEN